MRLSLLLQLVTCTQLMEICVKATHQKIKKSLFIERCGATLQARMRTTAEQCRHEGPGINIEMAVAQCIVVGNAVTTLRNATLYRAVLGGQPVMLPPLAAVEVPASPQGDSTKGRRRGPSPGDSNLQHGASHLSVSDKPHTVVQDGELCR